MCLISVPSSRSFWLDEPARLIDIPDLKTLAIRLAFRRLW